MYIYIVDTPVCCAIFVPQQCNYTPKLLTTPQSLKFVCSKGAKVALKKLPSSTSKEITLKSSCLNAALPLDKGSPLSKQRNPRPFDEKIAPLRQGQRLLCLSKKGWLCAGCCCIGRFPQPQTLDVPKKARSTGISVSLALWRCPSLPQLDGSVELIVLQRK